MTPEAETRGGGRVRDLSDLLARAVQRGALPADGKSGARLELVRLGDGRAFVVKYVDPRRDWIMRATGDTGRVAGLWSSGVLAGMPSVIDHAVEFVVAEAAGCVVVMRDVSDALFPAGRLLSRAESRWVLAAAADLHAAFRDAGAPHGVAPLAELYRFLSPAAALRLCADAEVPRLALAGWERFVDLVPPDVAAGVALVHERPESFAERLTRYPCTLVHGDLKVANLGFAGDRVVVLDWGSLTTWAPPAVDYAWFLAVNGASVDATHDELLDDVRRAGGSGHDEEAMRLALLGSLAQLGWEKALGATEAGDGAVRRSERDGLAWWAARARDGLEVWGEG